MEFVAIYLHLSIASLVTSSNFQIEDMYLYLSHIRSRIYADVLTYEQCRFLKAHRRFNVVTANVTRTTIGSYRQNSIAIESEAGDSLT